jgi:16S rRNA (cytidine1402-2'-O)-methyltransferase
MGIFYIVATPIGNLDDISLRAVKVLQSVDVILCEDTRRTGLLLQNLNIEKKPKLVSYYEQNEAQKIPEAISALKDGLNIALVSDAGTPLISDPGFKLVRECIREKIKIESIPGASSVTTALTLSGLPTDKFLFLGFLPRKPGHRAKRLRALSNELKTMSATIIMFEAPHKILITFEEIKNEFGDIEIVICRELTKIHEEVLRGKISDLITHFSKSKAKGELVILFHL